MTSVHEAAPILQAEGITKRFGPLTANDEIAFDLRAGEVHALVGENGAGKTTLMRVLYGMYQPDEGEVIVRGQPRRTIGFRCTITTSRDPHS